MTLVLLKPVSVGGNDHNKKKNIVQLFLDRISAYDSQEKTLEEIRRGMGSIPLILSRTEEQELFKFKEENPEEFLVIKDIITRYNIRLVISIVKKEISKNQKKVIVGFDDLVQVGVIQGLSRAIEKFDWREGCKFSTYAVWWIRQSVRRELDNMGRSIRVPVHMLDQRRKFCSIQIQLCNELGREPSLEEIAEEWERPLEEVISFQKIIGQWEISSLDEKFGPDSEESLLSVIPGKTEDLDAQEKFAHNDAITKILERLTPRQRDIIILRFGLNGERPHTLEEVGIKFYLTRERIRQIEEEALRKLRKYSEILKGLLD